ncbi:MAG TPA: protein kinase, partial [Kofleriaceae bacterium]|nr:protein kinase [Kofleriaceae bacterium]
MACLAEETVLGFLSGELSPLQAASVDEHLEDCASCRQLLRVLARGSEAGAPLAAMDDLARSPTLADLRARASELLGRELAAGAKVGRYVVQHTLGEGGMGVVYAAFDPELDRSVALKLLRPELAEGGGEAAAARLQREGRAIAKLAHPNVVTVFDVGAHDGAVFVAMELVDGGSLDAWIHERPRSWQEVVPVFLQAGAGLIAAHEAGMVHRDFKPANVLIGKDGRARVTDFGLARLGTRERRPSSTGLAAGSSDAVALTRTGAIMGTPAYMAPEQFEARDVDPRTDQFSFAVALYEALYGERPFPGSTASELYANIIDEKVRPPATTGVPGWLREVVLRGLRATPEDRHPTLAAMLEHMRRDPAAKRRRIVIGAGGLLAVGAAAAFAGAMLSRGAEPDPCARVAEIDAQLWGAATRRAFVDSLGRASGPDGARDVERAASVLDEYAGRIVNLRGEACRATLVEHRQSPALYDRKMICLNGSREAARSLIDHMRDPTPAQAKRALRAAERLPPLTDCENDAQLLSSIVLPGNAEERARYDEVESERQRARVVANLGDIDGALKMLRELEQGLGDALAQSRAKLACMQASYQEVKSQFDDAAKGYERCAGLASKASDQDTLITAWLGSMGVEGFYKGEVRRALDRASMIATALEGRPARLRAIFYQNHSLLLESSGDGAAALRELERAVPLVRDELHDTTGLAAIYNNMSAIYSDRGDFAKALELQRQSLALREPALGPTHRDVLTTRANIASTLVELGQVEEGMRAMRELLPQIKAELGPKHTLVGNVLVNLSAQLETDGKFREALALATEALELRREVLAPDHLDTAYAHRRVGRAYAGLEDLVRAREHL